MTPFFSVCRCSQLSLIISPLRPYYIHSIFAVFPLGVPIHYKQTCCPTAIHLLPILFPSLPMTNLLTLTSPQLPMISPLSPNDLFSKYSPTQKLGQQLPQVAVQFGKATELMKIGIEELTQIQAHQACRKLPQVIESLRDVTWSNGGVHSHGGYRLWIVYNGQSY